MTQAAQGQPLHFPPLIQEANSPKKYKAHVKTERKENVKRNNDRRKIEVGHTFSSDDQNPASVKGRLQTHVKIPETRAGIEDSDDHCCNWSHCQNQKIQD